MSWAWTRGPSCPRCSRGSCGADPALNPPAARHGTTHGTAQRDTVVRPAQLPAAVADFTGRTRLAAELLGHLTPVEGPAMAVAAVAGIGGVGKTTLAVHVAHAARHHFPAGQLYVDLQGAGRARSLEVVPGAFLRALGVQYETIPSGVHERAALYRSTLASRRVLTLLDNARDASQVRPLLPGAEGCAALVTSRAHLALDGALVIDLDVMTPAESHTLFARIVGPERIADDHQAASAVVAACGYLPLAIRIAASRLATRRRWSVATLATKLTDERNRLDELRVGDLAVTACFEVGYAQLDAAQARAFCLLGLPETPDISLPAAAALLDLPGQAAEGIIESLVDASLLEATTPDRYRFQDLVRLYARARAETDQPAEHREAALSRLLDLYLATARGVYAWSRPGDRVVDHMAATRHEGLAFATQEAASDWLFAEAEGLLALFHQSLGGARQRQAVDLLIVSKDLVESGAVTSAFHRAALACRDAARTTREARACLLLSLSYRLLNRLDEADEASRQALALALATSVADPIPRCEAHTDRGIVAVYRHRYADAERHFQTALPAFRADDNLPGVANSLSNVSRVYAATGRAEGGDRAPGRVHHPPRALRGRPPGGQQLVRHGHRPDPDRAPRGGDGLPQPRQGVLPQPPAAAVGGLDARPTRRGVSRPTTTRPGHPPRRMRPRTPLHRRGEALGHHAHHPRPGPRRAGPDRSGPRVLERGAGCARAAGLSGTARRPGPVGRPAPTRRPARDPRVVVTRPSRTQLARAASPGTRRSVAADPTPGPAALARPSSYCRAR